MRPALTAALLASLALAAPASAGPTCRMIVDKAYDEHHGLQRPDLDLLSGDLANDAKAMTTVVRVRSARPPATDAHYGLAFVVGTTRFRVTVGSGRDGAHGILSASEVGSQEVGEVLGAVTATVDPARSEVRATFPLSMLAPRQAVTAGTPIRIEGISSALVLGSAEAPLWAGPVPVYTGAGYVIDTATAPRVSYRAGSASCVTVGR